MMAALPLDLVDADRFGTRQIAVHQAPADGVPHRIADMLPGGVEDGGHFLPGEPPSPAGQKPLIAGGQPRLAVGPRNLLDDDPTTWAIDAPQCVDEHHGDLPQRHVLEAAGCQAVVAGPVLPAAGTDRPAIGPRADRHFEGWPQRRRRPSGEFRRRKTCFVRRD